MVHVLSCVILVSSIWCIELNMNRVRSGEEVSKLASWALRRGDSISLSTQQLILKVGLFVVKKDIQY